MRDLARVDQMADRVAFGHLLLDRLLARPLRLRARRDQRGGALGARQAGMDDGDVDARGPELVGQVLGHRRDRDVADAADGVAGSGARPGR